MFGSFAADFQPPLWDRLLVAAMGPLITVLIGGLAVWGVTSTVQQRRERADRKRDEDRADSVRAEDRRSRDDTLRQDLVGTMTEAAGSLYLMTQHYWRAKEDVKRNPNDTNLAEIQRELRKRLDAQYLESRSRGEVVENRLEGYFVSAEPREKWHQVMDLLTVRYFQLIDRDTDQMYRNNEGQEHSGLSVPQMKNPIALLGTYRAAIKDAVRSVVDGDLRSRSS
jgi:hypothetical protein